MLNKTSLIILYLLEIIIHITISLKSTDICIQKHKECKGFYVKQENYQTKCNFIKCNVKLSHECGLDLCTNTAKECHEYISMNSYIQNLTDTTKNTNNRTYIEIEKLKYHKRPDLDRS